MESISHPSVNEASFFSEGQRKTNFPEESIQMEPQWKKALLAEFSKPYMLELKAFLKEQIRQKKTIYPKGPEYFAAFNSCPLDNVKVVILGQDPYHGAGQAHGLCFSVRKGVPIPPSLQNIYKELQADLSIAPVRHGYLMSWAEQGVLLLNATLTVEAGKAGSHQGKGWERFTDRAVEVLNEQKQGLVFLLWGSYAQKKGAFIDTARHLVLKAVHPSPLSAHRGFLGCRHFSTANQYLEAQGKSPIHWQLAD